MLSAWSSLVESLASLVLAVGEAVGDGRVAGIVLTVLVLRIALIPILTPLATRTRDRNRIVRRIKPQIKALDREFRDDPGTLSRRLKALHEEHGIGMVDWPGLLGAFVQVPILIALFQAVLEVWPADALTPGGVGLGMVAGAVSLVGTKVSGQAEGAEWMLWMAGGLPVAICLWLGTGVGLYLTGFYSAAAIQGLLMRRGAVAESATDPSQG